MLYNSNSIKFIEMHFYRVNYYTNGTKSSVNINLNIGCGLPLPHICNYKWNLTDKLGVFTKYIIK